MHVQTHGRICLDRQPLHTYQVCIDMSHDIFGSIYVHCFYDTARFSGLEANCMFPCLINTTAAFDIFPWLGIQDSAYKTFQIFSHDWCFFLSWTAQHLMCVFPNVFSGGSVLVILVALLPFLRMVPCFVSHFLLPKTGNRSVRVQCILQGPQWQRCRPHYIYHPNNIVKEVKDRGEMSMFPAVVFGNRKLMPPSASSLTATCLPACLPFFFLFLVLVICLCTHICRKLGVLRRSLSLFRF